MTLMQQLAKKTRERRPAAATYTGPDKTTANGNRPLTFPTPYHGGKRRWAEQILQAFGDERECVYVEPFSGSAAVLLANPRPFAREILCDTNPHISNVFRCLAWAPETTAFWADWPTTHQDLTARHTWLLRWAVDHVADIEADPDFHDPKAAGWWLWGKSNWIGSEFGIVRGLQSGGEPTAPDGIPAVCKGAGGPTGQGVQAQRTTLPTAHDGMPHVGLGRGGPTAQGVQAQRTTLPTAHDKMPMIEPKMGGQGVQAQRYDDGMPVRSQMPMIEPKMGGQGVQAQRYDDGLPTAHDKRPTAHRPSGVSAQVDKIPHVKELTAGRGVSAQRHGDILYGGGKGYQPPRAPDAPPDKIPHIAQNGGGIGITAQREGISDDGPPDASYGARGAIGRARQDRQAQPSDKRPAIPGHGPIALQTHSRDMSHMPSGDGEPFVPRSTPVPLTGDRLRPWFQALAERLYRVIILNRGWQAGLTPTVLQQTRTARKPPVRVLIDPPYKGVGKLYGMSETEADALAIASWRWAAENGSREGWRIAYCCREGDFDDEALALGWTCSKTGIAANHTDSIQEVVWFSPHCLRPGQQRRQAPGEQGRMFETGE